MAAKTAKKRGTPYTISKTRKELPKVQPGISSDQRLKAADYTALPLLRNLMAEKGLVNYIFDRIKFSDDERRQRIERLSQIDIQLSGYIQLSKDDLKRQIDNQAGKSPKPTDHNLPLADAQIDEAVTYLMSIFAPEMDFFEATAAADKQHMASAITAEINKQGQKGQYYRHIMKLCLNAVKYNISALTCYWEKYNGIVFKGAPGGAAEKKYDLVWEGNVLNSVNMYNFFYDVTVHPVDLPLQGEYFAEVERKTPFRVRKMAQDGQLYGINRYVTQVVTMPRTFSSASDTNLFYVSPPSVRDRVRNPTTTGGNISDWSSVVAGSEKAKESSPGIELLWYTGWMNAKALSLGTEDELQLWRIGIANGQYLTFAKRLEDSHGMLPICVAAPLEDDLKNEQRTYAEKLLPLQHFASFLMNAHQKATRKSIAGITVYDASKFPGIDLESEDLIGAKIPMRSSGVNVDIDKAFRHYTDSPDTQNNVEQIQVVIGLMQKILPTDMLKQVADLERATLYQAAATVQAGNRRQLKIARIISDQAFNALKFQMVYNLYAHLPSVSYIDEATGERKDLSIGDLVDAGIEYDIGTGLKGIDRLMTIQIIRDVVNSVIQSQQAIAEIDIVKLLDHYSSLAGDKTDLTQFRRQPPPGQPGAAQNGQQPQATPPGVVAPTNPGPGL